MQQSLSSEQTHQNEYQINKMKKLLVLAALCMAFVVSAQTPSERYEQRYDLLVSRFGAAGAGVETVLDNWAKVDSTNARLLIARFDYYFTKAQTVGVVMKDKKKYLGMEPVLTFKDSLQRDVYCYQETFYDDELYGSAIKAIDKGISVFPDRLDFRFVAVRKEWFDLLSNGLEHCW